MSRTFGALLCCGFVRLSERFQRAVREVNETRESDVFVVNFGAHYHYAPGKNEDEQFKTDIAPILDAMAELGDKATVVWRCVRNL